MTRQEITDWLVEIGARYDETTTTHAMLYGARDLIEQLTEQRDKAAAVAVRAIAHPTSVYSEVTAIGIVGGKIATIDPGDIGKRVFGERDK